MGVEIDRRLIEQSDANARQAGVADRVSFRQEDLFVTRLNDVTVLTLFLAPPILLAGAMVTLHKRFEPGLWLHDVATRKPTLSLLVPATVSWLGRWNWWMPERGRRLLRLPAVMPAAES